MPFFPSADMQYTSYGRVGVKGRNYGSVGKSNGFPLWKEEMSGKAYGSVT